MITGEIMRAPTSVRSVLRTIFIGFLFEDGVAKQVRIEWSRGMTVLEGLTRASNKPHGIVFVTTGVGGSTFVTEIDCQANDRRGSWVFWVNGEFATIGCGLRELNPGDVVRWEFVTLDPKAH